MGVKEKDVTKYGVLGYSVVLGIMNHTRARKREFLSLVFFLLRVYNHPNSSRRVK